MHTFLAIGIGPPRISKKNKEQTESWANSKVKAATEEKAGGAVECGCMGDHDYSRPRGIS